MTPEIIASNTKIDPKPFLRWAGGKSWFLKFLDKYLPDNFGDYHEPFLGGGAVFIHLKSQGLIKNKAYLMDSNIDLINSYKIVKSRPEELAKDLSKFKNEADCYYETRQQQYSNPVERAAQFIYLNRTSFNGIYRVNQKGEYNVPFGNKKYSQLFDYNNLFQLSLTFKSCYFKSGDFGNSLKRVKKGDLVFLDPPYTVAHENNGFVKYNQKIFAWEDQLRLLRYIETINEIGAYFIMTNACHKSIEDLFSKIGQKNILSRASVIGGKGAQRKSYREFIFTNIEYV